MAPTLFASILWIILTFLGTTTSDQGDSQFNSTLHFIEQPRDVVVRKNSPLWMPCSVEASADIRPYNIVWYRDGEVVSDSRLTTLPNGTLYISRVIHKVQKGRSDEGDYYCVVRNNIGTIFSRTAKVQVANLGRFSGEPADVTVVQGQLARFQCQVDGVPSPNITWEKNRQPLPQDHRYTSLPSGVLQISNVTSSDQGAFRCRAINLAQRERHSAEAQLTLTQGVTTLTPRLLAGPQDQSVSVGQSAMLECSITGLTNTPLTWTTPKGDLNNLLPHSDYNIVGQGNLLITSVQPSDEGIYICSAGSIRSQASLAILEPPRVTSLPINIAKPSTVLTVRIQCTFSGTQPISITWYKDGSPLPIDGKIVLREEGSLLSVPSPDPAHSGYYQCVGENEAGTDSQISRLLIYPDEAAPNAPRGLVATQVSSTSIRLTWQAPPNQNSLLNMVGYSVHYKHEGDIEMQQVSQNTSLLISQLLPHTNYTFYVVAFNQKSASAHSRVITQVTDDDVPKVAPEVTVTPVDSTSLHVSWDSISSNLARGTIVAYRIVYRLSGHHDVYQKQVQGNVYEYTLTDLEPDQYYDVRVLAGTKKGFPELEEKHWPWVTQLMNADSTVGLPSKPDVRFDILNSTAIRVSWTEPKIIGSVFHNKNEVLGYQLIFHQPEDEDRRTLILVPEERNKTLTKLEPNTLYRITFFAFNQNGDGDSVVREIRTFDVQGSKPPVDVGPPPVTSQVRADPLNDSTVRVTWDRPHSARSVLYYTVRSIPISDGGYLDVTRAKETNSTETTVIVNGLEPFKEYSFAVKSHTRTQSGAFSSEVRCHTREGLPSAPRNPMGKVHSPQAVELSWQPPAQANGIILTYVIFYSVNSSHPDMMWMKKRENGLTTHAVVQNLDADEVYFFKLRAATKAGEGPPTNPIKIQTSEPAGYRRVHRTSERDMGIIIGVCIGGGCIIICALIVLLRNRCFPPRPHQSVNTVRYHSNGCVVNANGNGLVHGPPQFVNHCNIHELDSLAPMLTRIPENENSDSKGGTYIRLNGGLNGLLVNGMADNFLPNGKCKSYIIHDHSFQNEQDDCPQIPLRSYSLHNQPGEPITVQLLSMEDIDRSFTVERSDQNMKASPSSSGVTDCTQGPVDLGGGSSNTSSQNASLERHGHYPATRSSSSSYKSRGKERGSKKTSPHSTLSSSSASSTTTALGVVPGEPSQQPEGLLATDEGAEGADTWPDRGRVRKQHVEPQVHVQEPVGLSVLTHISSQGHGPGRPGVGAPPLAAYHQCARPVHATDVAAADPLSRSQAIRSCGPPPPHLPSKSSHTSTTSCPPSSDDPRSAPRHQDTAHVSK